VTSRFTVGWRLVDVEDGVTLMASFLALGPGEDTGGREMPHRSADTADILAGWFVAAVLLLLLGVF
jgi:hypothetical protein